MHGKLKEDICFFCRIHSMVSEEFFITIKLSKNAIKPLSLDMVM